MFFAVLSWIMPAGAYDRVLDPNTGRNIVDPNSFHYLPKPRLHLSSLYLLTLEVLPMLPA